MKRSTKNIIFSAATAMTIGAALVGLTSVGASAINETPCDSDEFLKISYHRTTDLPGDKELCLANGGEYTFSQTAINKMWLTQIHTGNNHVQWFGDGRWQPDQPIAPNTTFTWDNHPGGVRADKIRIV